VIQSGELKNLFADGMATNLCILQVFVLVVTPAATPESLKHHLSVGFKVENVLTIRFFRRKKTTTKNIKRFTEAISL